MFDRSGRLARLLSSSEDGGAVDVLTDVLDSLPVGAALYDASDDRFRIEYVNRTVEQQFSTPASRLLGLGVVEAFGEPAADFLDAFRQVRATGRPWRQSEYGAPGSRNRYLIEARPIPERPRPRHILAWWYEVTPLVAARNRAETALELALELARPLAAAELVGRLMERAAEETGAERAVMARLDGSRLLVEATHGVEAGQESSGLVLSADDEPVIGQALSSGRPRAGRLSRRTGALLRMSRADAELAAVPLVLDGAAQGLLLLGRVEGPAFGEPDLELLELIGSHAALALQNARTADRLRLGVDMAVALASQLEPVAVIRSLLQMTVKAMAGRATLSRVTGEELVVVDSYSEQLPAFPIGTRWRRADYPLMNAALASGLPQTGEENRDPAYFPADVEIVAVPLHLDGQPFATLGLSRKHRPFTGEDLLTLKLVGGVAALALRNADLFEELRETSRTKTHLMNLVAHELRGPLSVITAYLAMLEAGAVTPEAATLKVLLEKIGESNALVDRLLLAARLEGGGRLSARLEEVDLAGVIESARDRLGAQAQLVQASVVVRLPGPGLRITTDAEQVGRILDNLLANAIAYSAGQAQIEVTASSQRSGAEVLVRDQGRGIPAESWETVFEQFTRLDDAGPPGTGLGLYISRHLAEGLGGRLEITDSRPNQGTTFRLALPLVPPGATETRREIQAGVQRRRVRPRA